MKSLIRSIKRHFGVTARQVAVHSQRPWYWRLLVAGLLILLGYLFAYWQFVGGGFSVSRMQSLLEENQALHVNGAHIKRQLQIEHSAQANLAKEIISLQDESMRLKEDVTFYRNILNDNAGAVELKFHSFRISKGGLPNHYDYYILLAQTGRHGNAVQGQLHFTLSTTHGEKITLLPNIKDGGEASSVKINFKYYQRLEGSLVVPSVGAGATVEASFVEKGASQAMVSQKVDLPI